MTAPCQDLREVWEFALRTLNVPRVVEAVVKVASELEGKGAVRILAVGKAAPAMAQGALAALGPRVEDVLLITSDGTPIPPELSPYRCLMAGHPVPDSRSLVAAQEARAFVREGQASCVVALVSGGTSALLCEPVGIPFEEKQAIVQRLLGSGADIRAINAVRRHLSAIKGGGLARAAHPRPVFSLLMNDVLGGQVHDIGSGPTVADPTTVQDARDVARQYLPGVDERLFRETLKADEEEARALAAQVVVGPEALVAEARGSLAAKGYRVRTLPERLGNVAELFVEYTEIAKSLGPGEAILRAAEPSVPLPSSPVGKGGRSCHLAALLVPVLPPGVAFLAGASDGVDGASGMSGALVDCTYRWTEDPAEALERFDSGSWHQRVGSGLPCRPTGVNVADLHILARARLL